MLPQVLSETPALASCPRQPKEQAHQASLCRANTQPDKPAKSKGGAFIQLAVAAKASLQQLHWLHAMTGLQAASCTCLPGASRGAEAARCCSTLTLAHCSQLVED